MKDTADVIGSLSLLQKAALLSGANTWQTRAIPESGLPAIWMADGPHGVRKQVGSADHLGINGSEPATCFPTAATVANSWDVALAGEIGEALGAEASSQGVHVLLGPGLNIKRSPLGGRNFEYFSEDPELAGRLAAAYVRGIQSAGVAASPKHFAVNSQELRRMVSDSVVDERTLRELYLTAFEIVVRESSPWTIMSSYNLVNGEYAHENAHLLGDILRDEWGFDGAVVSDWGGGNDPAAAVRAGGTLEMPSPGFDSARDIVAAVRSGALTEAELDARVGEVVALVRRVTAAEAATVDAAAHHALARRAAGESTVLLRNQDAILPLAPGTRVALVGDFARTPRYQGAGSSLVNALQVTNLVDALGDTDLDVVGHAAGFHRDGRPDAALVAEAAALAARADVVVLTLGLPEIAESEGMDRTTLVVPADQIALLHAVAAVNPRTVVVLSAGGVVEVPWLGEAAALLHGYLGGQAGAEGMADVLTGAVEPGGRLAETMPVSLGDTPTAGRFPSTQRTSEYREALSVGYRWYERAGIPVSFPFGFGLGYTSFAYSDLTVADGIATLTVTNTGSRAGSDVVQLYVGRLGESRVHRPRRELKGFAKVRLDAGASQTVTIPLGDRAFRYFDVDLDSWQVEGGSYEISIGHSSADLALAATVAVEGTVTAPAPSEPAVYRDEAVRVSSDEDFADLLRRPVPVAAWGRGPLGYNDPIDRIAAARSGLARLVFRFLNGRLRKAEASGHPDLNILFMFNAPFRVLSKMSGGLATRRLTDAVLTLVNGRTFRGIGAVIGAYLRGRRDEKRTAAEFRADGTRSERTRWMFTAIKTRWTTFVDKHPELSKFLMFFILSNGVTVLQLGLMPVFRWAFDSFTSLMNVSFQVLPVGSNVDGSQYFMFDYAAGALPEGGGGLSYFLSVQITLLIAQVINFFLQRNITFKSNTSIWIAAGWYALAYVVITFIAAAAQGFYKAPIYDLLMNTWGWGGTGAVVADVITMIINSAISFWVFYPIFKVIFRQKKDEPAQVVTSDVV